MTVAAAPGKVVIWGEYAVLEGAPALVMAVNRYARVSISECAEGWRLSSAGYVSEQTLGAEALRAVDAASTNGPAAVIRAALGALGDPPLPAGATVHMDTSALHHRGRKLGIGSSAAVCTAAASALAAHLDLPFDYDTARSAHRLLQGGGGSGLDVAAAYHGGLIRFEQHGVRQVTWPEQLCYRFLWAGHPADTTEHVVRFRDWRSRTKDGSLTDLCTASDKLFTSPSIALLHDYVASLKVLDGVAGLGIYDDAHRRLDELAIRAEVVYKPCGAGGGDVGIVLSDDPAALGEFVALAKRESFLILDLEIAAHGVHRISE